MRAGDPTCGYERMQLRNMAYCASQRYPGVVGQVLARYLHDWEQFGVCAGPDGLTTRLVRELSKPPKG